MIKLKDKNLLKGLGFTVGFINSITSLFTSPGDGIQELTQGDGIEIDDSDPANPVISAVVTVYQRKTILTDAQIKALPTTPIELVPAPGAGKTYIFHRALIVSKFTGGAYTTEDTDPGPFIGMPGAGDIKLALSENPDAMWLFTDNSEEGQADILPSAMRSNYVSEYENKPLILYTQTAINLTGGNAANTLEVTVFYSIVDL